ncbi:MAG: hypothetical protein CVV49_02045 [Spirochaetae bacterium HGW-Spirochaetae-5]|nr:MAG: hypothetical protein CVV49_02045 [Spirochaetae bacterium HGW-Spirochaetae-5]
MINPGRNQLALILDSEKPETVINEVQSIFFHSYKLESFEKIENAFNHICSLFNGKLKGYRACNTEYHDLKHTLDAFLAAARLIDGRNITSGIYNEDKAVSLLLAALLHDTGYIQEESDTDGTGAKYTSVHVKRSIEFTEKNAGLFQISPRETAEISSFIACTGIKSDYIATLNNEDRIGGCILGTADLIGQMSDRAYLEKLLFLYYEFSEAGVEGFDTTFDILRKTLSFYESTMDRLNITLDKSYNLAGDHFKTRFGINENLYMTAIEKQMDYLKTIIDDESTNFRNKLKRLNVEGIEERYKIHPH